LLGAKKLRLLRWRLSRRRVGTWLAATYLDKIVNRARSADLTVEQPTKFELVVNLRAAKARA
jgi:hypothetical protein